MMKKGDRIRVSGNSDELWIEDYNCNVDSEGTVEETPSSKSKKVLVTLDYIDGQGNVCVRIRKSKIRPLDEEE